ncbi:hypothetical protein GGI04_004171 [Coemansia thaxteri]|uniref:ATP synthase subunit K, mitochondrial n=1 Tax=Coemansia thaxteri TaxID=2663907 RepID=A0A9W8BFL0_9FUNG|nr:hypothetical protein GGI04_004171 [Coemansia thaxteri]KAJ2001553.1 hypothetical protein H4R26_004072 [Coemansia thaxteri]KAJ2329227.1 hypothetical protein GGH92_009733 [Coemansia sp. RSA 2673]KAJ2473651.1 hypothetical protein GGI02_000709 [Coemansia sp. RSA 2322]KAJ2482088.1 hypothetical protein EV174_003305 [Coemansia sp. RSA 2320]
MGGYFNIAGRKVATHHLVLGVLAGYGLVFKAVMPKTDKTQAPPIKASSDEESRFIQDFLKAAEAEDKKAAH